MKAGNELEPLAIGTNEAAKLLGISRPMLYQYVGRNDFPSFKLGNRTLVSVAGLRKWVENQTIKEEIQR